MVANRASPGAEEHLPRQERLRRRADYLRCYREGGRRSGRLAILYFASNDLGHPRIGITVSRKVGRAVTRHRLKRRIREIYRRWDRRHELPALDLVFHLQPAAAKADFSPLQAEIQKLLRSLLSGAARGR